MPDHIQPYQWPDAPATPATPTLVSSPPDPGRPIWAVLSWILGGVFLLAIILINQLPESEGAKPVPVAEIAAPTIADPFTLTTKMMVKLGRGGMTIDAASMSQIASQVEMAAHTPLDKVRGAMALAELREPKDGLRMLDRIAAKDIDSDALAGDIALVRTLLVDGPEALDEASVERLIEHHGWFARLAMTRGKGADDPERRQLLAGGALVVGVAGLVLVLVVIGVLGGLGCAITAIVLTMQGKLKRRFLPPAPGGSVYLEMAGVLIACFLAMKLVLPLILHLAGVTEAQPAITVSLAVQWSLVLVLLWPLVRGVGMTRWRMDLGLHAGRGFFTEVGAGVFMYLAGLPLLGLAVGLSLVLMLLKQVVSQALFGEDAAPPTNPLLDLLTSASPGQIALFASLAIVWAPLVEETVFRGALYRHLRSRVGVASAVGLSALVFGLMHGYELLMLGPVISLGIVFALMREWRSSLIPSITAHALHNATVTLVLIMLLSAVRD